MQAFQRWLSFSEYDGAYSVPSVVHKGLWAVEPAACSPPDGEDDAGTGLASLGDFTLVTLVTLVASAPPRFARRSFVLFFP